MVLITKMIKNQDYWLYYNSSIDDKVIYYDYKE